MMVLDSQIAPSIESSYRQAEEHSLLWQSASGNLKCSIIRERTIDWTRFVNTYAPGL